MPWLYILKCADGSYYTGTTNDLSRRFAEHQEGLTDSYTHKRRPVELVFSVELSTWPETIARERQIKGWNRKKKEALIQNDWETLKALSKNRTG